MSPAISGLKAIYRAKCRTSATPPTAAIVERLAAVDSGHLSTLDLSGIPIDATFFSVLECLVIACGVTTIDFSSAEMTDENVETLCHHLFRAASVEELRLKKNPRISDIGARSLMDFAKHQQRLIAVEIDGTSISNKMRDVLNTALEANKHGSMKEKKNEARAQKSSLKRDSIIAGSLPGSGRTGRTASQRGVEGVDVSSDHVRVVERLASIAASFVSMLERIVSLLAWERRMSSFIMLVTLLSCLQGSLTMTLTLCLIQSLMKGRSTGSLSLTNHMVTQPHAGAVGDGVMASVGSDVDVPCFARHELRALRSTKRNLESDDAEKRSAAVMTVSSWLERAQGASSQNHFYVKCVCFLLVMSFFFDCIQILTLLTVGVFLYFPLLSQCTVVGSPATVNLRRRLAELISPDRAGSVVLPLAQAASPLALASRAQNEPGGATSMEMFSMGSSPVGKLPPRELLGLQQLIQPATLSLRLVCLEGHPPSGSLRIQLRCADGDIWLSPSVSSPPWCWDDDAVFDGVAVNQTIRVFLRSDEAANENLQSGKLLIEPSVFVGGSDEARIAVRMRRMKLRGGVAGGGQAAAEDALPPSHFDQLVAEVHRYERDERRKYSLLSLDETHRASSRPTIASTSSLMLQPACTLILVATRRGMLTTPSRAGLLPSASPAPKPPQQLSLRNGASAFGNDVVSQSTSRASSFRHDLREQQ